MDKADDDGKSQADLPKPTLKIRPGHNNAATLVLVTKGKDKKQVSILS